MLALPRWGKIVIAGLACFAAGFAAHAVLSNSGHEPRTIADHWRVVNSYRAHILNPANYTYDPRVGLSSTTPPPDPEPSLFALVNAGELNHLDLVFPTVQVSEQANRLWMKFAESRDDIAYATGYPSSDPADSYYKTSGTKPLHLNLWFKPSAREAVQKLIKELEEAGAPQGN